MSDWKVPDVPERKHENAPPLWIPIVALFVVLAAGVIFGLQDAQVGKPIVTGDFITRALIVPVLMWGLLCAVYYDSYESGVTAVDWWNYLCRDDFARWRGWSKWNLAILDSVILTPEVDLAERMLGLDGIPPENTGERRTLDGNSADPARVEQIIEKLVTPLYAHLNLLKGSEAVRVVLTAPSEAYMKPLHAVLERTKMPRLHPENLAFAHAGEEAALIDKWLEMSKANYSRGEYRPRFEACLVVALQLHDPDVPPTFTEAGVALLLTSHQVAKQYKIEPRARLFRPAVAGLPELAEKLEAVFTAAPTPVEKHKHVWTSGLAKLARHNVNGTLDRVDRELARHEVDTAIGLAGPANTWLMQALAAQMVTYGQGPQLVIAPAPQGVMLNLLGAQYASVPEPSEPPFNPLPVAKAAGVICCGALMVLAVLTTKVGPVWFWSVVAFILLLCFVGVPASTVFIHRSINKAFYEATRH